MFPRSQKSSPLAAFMGRGGERGKENRKGNGQKWEGGKVIVGQAMEEEGREKVG